MVGVRNDLIEGVIFLEDSLEVVVLLGVAGSEVCELLLLVSFLLRSSSLNLTSSLSGRVWGARHT